MMETCPHQSKSALQARVGGVCLQTHITYFINIAKNKI